MKIVLDNHIPIPETKRKTRTSVVRAALTEMSVGQSFVLRSPSSIYVYGKALPERKFVYRPEGKAFRCWRTT